jgi:hypothetical protein
LVCAVLAAAAACTFSTASASAAVAPWQKGVNFTAWWHDSYAQPAADTSLGALAATGTERVAIVVTWYMDTPTSSDVRPDANRTPSDASLLHSMATARAAGMDVVLKPHVDLQDGSFRALIQPADRQAWFDTYRHMSNHYADLAAQAGARMLIVGTELTTMSSDEQQWRRVIAEARARFPGEMTFAANHVDGAQVVAFWDALDYIGIDAYMPLATTANPSVDELASAWRDRGYVAGLGALHRRFGKPVLLTELGYQSRFGTAITPWGGAPGAISDEPQARAYEAAYRAFWDVPWFAGIYWWDWSATGAGDPGGHPFARKAAAGVVIAWNARARSIGEPAAEPTPVAPGPDATSLVARALPGARIALRVRGARVIEGAVRRGATPCATRVTLRVRGTDRRGRRVRRSAAMATSAAGKFRVSLRRLARGRYRAQATATAGGCGRARAAKLAFRVR